MKVQRFSELTGDDSGEAETKGVCVCPESLRRYIWEADSYKSNYCLKIAQQRADGLTGTCARGSEIHHDGRQTREEQNK